MELTDRFDDEYAAAVDLSLSANLGADAGLDRALAGQRPSARDRDWPRGCTLP